MPYLLILGIGGFFLLDALSDRHKTAGFEKPSRESSRY